MFVYKRSGRGRVREGNNKGNEEEQRYGEEIRDKFCNWRVVYAGYSQTWTESDT